MSLSVGLQCPHTGTRGLTSTSSFPFWEPISREAEGPGQGSLGCGLCFSLHLP